MNHLIVVFVVWIGLSVSTAHGQLLLKLQWIPDSLAWGVFIKPETGTNPSSRLFIGSGQVTIVAPKGYSFRELKSFSLSWTQNAYVSGPVENPGRDYISFGLASNELSLPLKEGMETLLFTFSKKSENPPDSLYLLEANDLFAELPNSAHSNPGNELSVLDLEKRIIYSYSGNYGHQTWNPSNKNNTKTGPFLQGINASNQSKLIKP